MDFKNILPVLNNVDHSSILECLPILVALHHRASLVESNMNTVRGQHPSRSNDFVFIFHLNQAKVHWPIKVWGVIFTKTLKQTSVYSMILFIFIWQKFLQTSVLYPYIIFKTNVCENVAKSWQPWPRKKKLGSPLTSSLTAKSCTPHHSQTSELSPKPSLQDPAPDRWMVIPQLNGEFFHSRNSL